MEETRDGVHLLLHARIAFKIHLLLVSESQTKFLLHLCTKNTLSVRGAIVALPKKSARSRKSVGAWEKMLHYIKHLAVE